MVLKNSQKRKTLYIVFLNLNLQYIVSVAGVAGFEPTNDGVRVRCLTAWRHPNFYIKNQTTRLIMELLYKTILKISSDFDAFI